MGTALAAVHWMLLTLTSAGAVMSTFFACLLAGAALTSLTWRLRLPFGGCPFAAVVPMFPGTYMFRMADGLVTLAEKGSKTPLEVLAGVLSDATTALAVVLAIGFGLIIPALCLDRRWAWPAAGFGRGERAHAR